MLPNLHFCDEQYIFFPPSALNIIISIHFLNKKKSFSCGSCFYCNNTVYLYCYFSHSSWISEFMAANIKKSCKLSTRNYNNILSLKNPLFRPLCPSVLPPEAVSGAYSPRHPIYPSLNSVLGTFGFSQDTPAGRGNLRPATPFSNFPRGCYGT
jgi:hypothetical protein